MQIDWTKYRELKITSKWPKEDEDFTPWVAKWGIHKLEYVLGFNIMDAKTEYPVGPFKADIFAREKEYGRYIVIENQFMESNHDHLGKLITYAVGKNAGYAVWIAESFHKEHLYVIRKLNQTFGVKFFALEVGYGHIDKLAYVTFEVVEKPNGWNKGKAGKEAFPVGLYQ